MKPRKVSGRSAPRKRVAAVPKVTFNPQQLVTQNQLAAVVGSDQSVISRLTLSDVLQRVEGQRGRNGSGLYELASSVQKYQRHRLKEAAESPSTLRHRDALSRKSEAQAEIAEIELAKRKDEIVDIDTVMMFLEDKIIRARTRLMIIPVKLSRKIGRPTADVVRLEITQALNEIGNVTPNQISKSVKDRFEADDPDTETDYE
jgi:hypothetical protein